MSCLLAWLLIAIMACLPIHSPHCDLCDGPTPSLLSDSQHALVHHPPPPSKDERCNTVCSCCALIALPRSASNLMPGAALGTQVWPELDSPVLAEPAFIFRPPRLA